MTPRKIKIGTAAAALAVGAGFAIASPSSTAVAYSSPPLFLDVSVQSPGHLVARGAAVSVPVVVTCNSQGAYVTLHVTENVGRGRIARGYTTVSVGCTGGHQTILITVATMSNRAFAKGSAYAAADISGCYGNNCGVETASRTIKINK